MINSNFQFAQNVWHRLLFSGVLVLLFGPASVQGAPDVQPVLYSPHAAKFVCHMNMGPTGARAWMRGYEFQVMSIDQGSPADGALELGDRVVEANGTEFGPEADPRITLGNAIGQAEATGRQLKLKVLRKGRKRTVRLKLPRLGPYSPTWPADCAKSAQILDAACRQLLNAQLPNGKVVTDGGMGVFLTGLLLLASGEPAFLDGARRAAYHAASLDYPEIDYCNWPMGYGGVLLAEYYLATGDDTVLPKLAEICEDLAAGQMKCGSWGHSSPSGGYGALNQPGIVCAIALVLGRECGIDVDEEALEKALNFFGRYAMLGSIPYGDHMPGGAPDDNGHNASAAVLMKLAGRQAEADAFSQSVAMSYWMREEGHTGAFFSLVWGPLGAALAGDQAFRTFMDYQRWYYNLCRTWKGDLVLLPYQEALTRFDDSGYIYFGGDFTTGGLALAFAIPGKHLRILGAEASVFSHQTAFSGDVLLARKHYLAREWDACDKALAGIQLESLESKAEKRGCRQLLAARQRMRESTERLLMEIESNLIEGAAYRASEQFAALKRCLGETSDPRVQGLDERFAGNQTAWYVREGKQYYEAWESLRGFAVKSWVPQGVQAKHLIEGLPTLRQPLWEPLSPTSQFTPQTWRTLVLKKGDELPRRWEKPGFDDSGWKAAEGISTGFDQRVEGLAPDQKAAVLKNMRWQEKKALASQPIAARRVFTVEDPEGAKIRIRLQTVRPAITRVYLNGRQVVEAVRGQRGGYASIELDAAAMALLKKGRNLLAVTSTNQGMAGNHLDVGLDINRVPVEKRTLPVHRPNHIFLDQRTDGDFSLRVRETKREMEQRLQASYNEKPIPALLKDLENPVAYVRHLAENALVQKGLDGIEPAVFLADHPDWKVRSAVCNIVANAVVPYRKTPEKPLPARLQVQLPILMDMLDDEHFWVRTRAALAIAQFGESANPVAVPALIQQVNDSDEWVRSSVLRAIRAIKADPSTAVPAVLTALKTPGTSFTVPRHALAVLQKNPEVGRTGLVSLLTLLRNPPEGGGGALLNKAMDMAAALDPEGQATIQVLIDIAADKTHYSRQRGNPRGKAIELLGKYGEKASEATRILEAILASEQKKDQSQKEACEKALEAISGKTREENSQ